MDKSFVIFELWVFIVGNTRNRYDILRLNIESFLPPLDDPLHQGLVMSRDNQVHEMLMPKVYYLDMILKYSSLEDEEDQVAPIYDYIRLILNKKGLARIEQLT